MDDETSQKAMDLQACLVKAEGYLEIAGHQAPADGTVAECIETALLMIRVAMRPHYSPPPTTPSDPDE